MGIGELVAKVKSTDLGKRMASGAFWSFSGTAVAKALVLVAGIICAKILSKDEYGQFGMVRSTINMFVVFGSAGMGMTATKYISEYRKDRKDLIFGIYRLTSGFAVFTGMLVTVAILLLAPLLAQKTLKAPELVMPLRLGAIMLFVAVVNGAQNGALSGVEDFRSIAMNTLYGSIAESVLLLLGAWKFGITGAVAGYGFGFVVLYIANRLSIRKNFIKMGIDTARANIRPQDWRLLYKFSLPAALSLILYTPTYWIIKAILTNQSGFGEVAVFEAADQWRVIIMFVPTAISQIVLPILSNTGSENTDKFWKILKLNLLLNGGVALLMAICVGCLSPFIMGLYGKEYTDWQTLALLAGSTVFSSLGNVVGLSISSRAKMWMGFTFNLIWALMVIAFTANFVNKGMGAQGLGLAILLSYVIHTVLQFIYLRIVTPK